MQKILLLILLVANSFLCSYSQSVGIGTANPNAAAKLDVVSTNQGLLPPRLTYTQRNNIVNPVAGLMIWCSTCGTNGELQVYNGSSWQSMMNGVASDSLDAVLTSSLSSLPSFDFVNVSASSTSKSFTVSGIGLVNRPGILTIKSQSSEFQVSTDNITWDTTTSIVYNSSVLSPTLVYVRFSPQSIGSKTGIIKINGGGANEVSVSVSGTGISRITIAQLRAMYTTNMKITSSAYISGVVTSDAVNKNIGTGSAIIQDESGTAVIVYFGGTVFYNLGDSIILNITNDSLINYRGSLELKRTTGNLPPSLIATGKVVVPLVKTIAEVNAAIGLPLGNPGNFESSLIKILNASATGNTTFYGNNTLTDGSGSITLYTATAALFSGNQLPIGSLNWIGQAKNYAGITKEFLIRNINDVDYSNYVAPPSITSSVQLLTDFGNVSQLTNSTSQSFTLSGSYLTGAPGTITVTAPSTDFQVSNDNIN